MNRSLRIASFIVGLAIIIVPPICQESREESIKEEYFSLLERLESGSYEEVGDAAAAFLQKGGSLNKRYTVCTFIEDPDVGCAEESLFDAEASLVSAVEAGNPAAVRALVDAGADVNQRGKNGPVLNIAIAKSGDIATLLIKRGANVNASINGYTPLHAAIDEQQLAVAKQLLHAGADACAPAHSRGNALYYLKTNKDPGFRRLVAQFHLSCK